METYQKRVDSTQNELYYLDWAKRYKQHQSRSYTVNDFTYYVTSKGDNEIYDWLYKYGKDLNVLTATFEEFVGYLKGDYVLLSSGVYMKYRKYQNQRVWGRWYCYHPVEFREKMAYRRKPGHKKKEIDERSLRKTEWRENKAFSKDRRKHRHHYYDRVNKHESNRHIRNETRKLLRSEKYDRVPKKARGFWRYWW
jgi:hypothetical protein